MSVFRVARGETRAPHLGLAYLSRFDEIEPMPLCFGRKVHDFACGDTAQDTSDTTFNLDLMHVNIFYGGMWCDSSRLRLSDVCTTEGDTLEWVYDLGSAHRYTIRLPPVTSAPEDADAICLLDGTGNAAPTDCGFVEDVALLYNRLWPSVPRAHDSPQHTTEQPPCAAENRMPQELVLCGDVMVKEVDATLSPRKWWKECDILRKLCLSASPAIISHDYLSRFDSLCFDHHAFASQVRAAGICVFLRVLTNVCLCVCLCVC